MRLPALAGLCAAVFQLLLPAASPAAEEVNRIVLRVNDEILTLHDYEQRKTQEITAVLSNPRLEAGQRQELLSRVGREIMHQVFRELLLNSRSKQLGMSVGEAEVDDAVRELLKRQNFANQEELMQALASAGMTMEQLRDNVRRDLTMSQVIGSEVSAKIQVGEEELRAHYRNHADDYRIPERRWLKEIIVREASDLAPDQRRRVAEEIRGKLAAGGEIEEILEPYRSSGTTTGLIDLDWLRVDELEDSLAEAAWALQPGEYSPPIEARGGYHILHLAGLREAKLRPFSEVQDEILNRERDRRFTKEMRSCLAELENNAFVREDLPPDAVGYRSLAGEYTPEDELEVFRGPVTETIEDPAEGEGDTADP
ncbi:MAG: hypothetical protein GY856_47100 [bacterium]|nr:hypothetical protein [bacterium]